jgi:hypothetical protein
MLFIPRCFPAQQQLVQQEADLSRRAVEGLHRLSLDREQYAKGPKFIKFYKWLNRLQKNSPDEEHG